MLTLALVLTTARADDAPRTPVLVSSLQPQNADAAGLAGLIEGVLLRELARRADVAAIGVDDAPAFEDYDARTYMDACPPGQIVGCTQVLGARAQARFAVTGTVMALPDGASVQISILDIDGARQMLSFKSELAAGKDADFAAGVANVLVAAIHGDIGGSDDIRDETDDTAPKMSKEELRAQLEELSGELGELSEVLDVSHEVIRPPQMTREEIDAHMSDEGVKPWERVGLTPGAYLRWKNSGLDFRTWRQRAMGRAMQLHVRALGGWWRGPTDATFYNRYAYDESLNIVDSYTVQAVRSADTGTGALEVAFGVLPFLDVGVAGGMALGHFTVDVSSLQAPADPVTLERTTAWLGPRVGASFFPASPIRPDVGVGVSFVSESTAASTIEVPTQAYTFPTQWLVYAEAWGGAEVRLGENVDLFARVPVDVRLAGTTLRDHRDTIEAYPEVAESQPDAGADLGLGALVGVQLHLFGKKVADVPIEP